MKEVEIKNSGIYPILIMLMLIAFVLTSIDSELKLNNIECNSIE